MRSAAEASWHAEPSWSGLIICIPFTAAAPGAGLNGSSAVHSVQLLQSADHQIISRYLLPEIERSPSPSVTVATMEIEAVKFVFIPTQVTENIPNSRAWPRPGQYHPGREA